MWVFRDSDHIPENNRNSTEMNWKIKNLENIMYIIKEKTTAQLIAWFQKPDCLSSINKIIKLVSAGFDHS